MFAHPRLPAALSRSFRGRRKVILARHMKLEPFTALSSMIQALDHFLDRSIDAHVFLSGPAGSGRSLGASRSTRPSSQFDQSYSSFHMAHLIVGILYNCCVNSKGLVPSFLLVFGSTRCHASTFESHPPFLSCQCVHVIPA